MDSFQNNNPYMMLPGVSPEELGYVQQALSQLTENQQKYFYMTYTGKRKNPQDIMIFTIIGFFAVAGIQRFVLGQIAMGILYLFTGGFCLIGTIVDLVNNRSLTLEYNQKMVYEAFQVAKMSN
ncbi:MAG: TM2 domain-containing protein [Mucilaginibacter sp.]